MSTAEIILIYVLAGLLFAAVIILMLIARLDRDIIHMDQFDELFKMYQDVDRQRQNFKHWCEQRNLNIHDVDDTLFSYIYLSGKYAGITEAVEASEKIVNKIIY